MTDMTVRSGGTAADWMDAAPADRAAAAVRTLGKVEFASWCAAVLTGDIDMMALTSQSEPDPRWLAGGAWTNWGPPTTWVERGIDYWPRSWAARSLLHQWHPCAEHAVIAGLTDEHWRVREMCGKVVAKHELGTGADTCARVAAHDHNTRARVAALRAIGAAGEAEHAWVIAIARTDAEKSISSAAEAAKRRLEARLDRSLEDLP